ncbi:MAG: hypothetical protein MAG794_00212 [Gammaproteobacteria bacterium]|nr:hypothetical protein [Gammaproteobacteria bacterium]
MSEVENLELTGGCACGAVRFEASGLMRPVIACHCETCRRTSGHYWAATQAYEDDFRLIKDRGLKWFESSDFARRGFCAECGSSLFFQRHDSNRISIAGGSLDSPTGLREVEHICTSEAGDYYRIDTTLSCRDGNGVSEAFQLPPRD